MRQVGWGKPKAKRQSKAKQNYKGETAQQWHNYACLQRSSTGQQQISQLTLIIDNLIKGWCLLLLVRTRSAHHASHGLAPQARWS